MYFLSPAPVPPISSLTGDQSALYKTWVGFILHSDLKTKPLPWPTRFASCLHRPHFSPLRPTYLTLNHQAPVNLAFFQFFKQLFSVSGPMHILLPFSGKIHLLINNFSSFNSQLTCYLLERPSLTTLPKGGLLYCSLFWSSVNVLQRTYHDLKFLYLLAYTFSVSVSRL